jgi:hypothetical protein
MNRSVAFSSCPQAVLLAALQRTWNLEADKRSPQDLCGGVCLIWMDSWGAVRKLPFMHHVCIIIIYADLAAWGTPIHSNSTHTNWHHYFPL